MLKKMGYQNLEDGMVIYYYDTLGGVMYMRFRSKIQKIDTLTPIPKPNGEFLGLTEWEKACKTDSSIIKSKY